MAGLEEINPHEVSIGQSHRDSAERYVFDQMELRKLPLEKRSKLIESVAQALSVAEATLLLADSGEVCPLGIGGDFGTEQERGLLVWAQKYNDAVICKLVLVEGEDFAKMFKKE